jgi:hypothetical protein
MWVGCAAYHLRQRAIEVEVEVEVDELATRRPPQTYERGCTVTCTAQHALSRATMQPSRRVQKEQQPTPVHRQLGLGALICEAGQA